MEVVAVRLLVAVVAAREHVAGDGPHVGREPFQTQNSTV